jgi:hypothetical protein
MTESVNQLTVGDWHWADPGGAAAPALSLVTPSGPLQVRVGDLAADPARLRLLAQDLLKLADLVALRRYREEEAQEGLGPL